jgi:hypothetical protein
MVEFMPCRVLTNLLDSRLVAIKFMLRDTDMIDRDSFYFSAEFCKRAAAFIELQPVGIDK